MKPLAALVAGLSLSLSLFAGQAFAATGAEEGAKGLFFEQLQNPGSKLNTGIQYWIELHHNGQTIHATNKTTFHTGDRIRFHLRPNIDGYAYIMLKSGSRGEQAVLFPEKDRNEDNKITAGKEIILPNDGMLGFDDSPGTEKLTLVVSRKPIDTDSYLNKDKKEDAAPLVAMVSSGSKDLVPTQVYVAYLPPAAASASSDTAKNPPGKQNATSTTKVAAKTPAPASASATSEGSKKTSKPASTGKQSSNSNSSNAKDDSASGTPSTPATKKSKNSRHAVANASTKESKEKTNEHPLHVSMKVDDGSAVTHHESEGGPNPGLVTVVFKDPNATLSADISLEHLKE
jgi:hypothetical protein